MWKYLIFFRHVIEFICRLKITLLAASSFSWMSFNVLLSSTFSAETKSSFDFSDVTSRIRFSFSWDISERWFFTPDNSSDRQITWADNSDCFCWEQFTFWKQLKKYWRYSNLAKTQMLYNGVLFSLSDCPISGCRITDNWKPH